MELRYSEKAQTLADIWREDLERRFCSEEISPIFESHLSKYRSLMSSLALIFSVVSHLEGSEELPSEVDEISVQLAIKWCELLEQHAQKAYGEFLEPEMGAARILLTKIKSGSVQDYDRCRDLYRRGWKGLNTPEKFEVALEALKGYEWLRTEVQSSEVGRKSELIRLHPTLRK